MMLTIICVSNVTNKKPTDMGELWLQMRIFQEAQETAIRALEEHAVSQAINQTSTTVRTCCKIHVCIITHVYVRLVHMLLFF